MTITESITYLVNHVIDGVDEIKDLSRDRDGHLLREVTARDSRLYPQWQNGRKISRRSSPLFHTQRTISTYRCVSDCSHLQREIGRHGVYRIGKILYPAASE